MLKFCRDNKAYISILLCIVLLPMVTYASMIIDASRLQSARVVAQSAGDLAINAAMSEYDQVLQDMYGLFANAKSKEEIEPAIRNYFEETISGKIHYSETDDGKKVQKFANDLTNFVMNGENISEDELTNFLELQLSQDENVKGFEFAPIEDSKITNPAIMKAQIIDYMKYKGPVSVGNNLLNKLGFLKDAENQSKAIQQKIELSEKVADLGDPMKEAYNAIVEYNKAAQEYSTYTEDRVYKIMEQTADDLYHMSSLFLCNRYLDKLTKKYGISALSGYGNFNIDNYNFSFNSNWQSDTELNRVVSNPPANTETVDNATAQLDKLIVPLNEIVYLDATSLSKDENQKSYFESVYGIISYTFSEDLNAAVTMSRNDEYNDYKATYGNLNRWNSNMLNVMAFPEDYDYEAMFETQLELIPHASDFAEYKAYHEYFLKIKTLYDRKYNEYISIYKAKNGQNADMSSDENYKKYTKIHNLLIQLDQVWLSSDTYRAYDLFLRNVSDTGSYFYTADHYREKADDEFLKYYEVIKKLETTTDTANTKLGELITSIGGVETKANDVKTNIDTTVQDDSARSQMLSDVEALKKSVKKEDVENLKAIIDAYHTRFAGMRDKMEQIQYFTTDKDKLYGPFGTEWGNVTYGDREEYNYEIDEEAIKTHHDLYYEKFNIDHSNELLNTHIIVGHDYRSLVPEFKEAVKEITGMPAEETFFNVLKNTADAKGSGDAELEIQDGEKQSVNDLKSAADVSVDSEGKPSGELSTTIKNGNGSEEQPVSLPDTAYGNAENFKAAVAEVNSGNSGGGYGKAGNVSIGGEDADESKHKENAEKGKENLAGANDLLHRIANIADEFKNDVYLEEYFTEMFTCQTDKKLDPGKLQLINGYTNDPSKLRFINPQNEWYGKEMEYILWGNPELAKNLSTTEMTIFLLRFAINAIYAFSASDIQSMANAMAELLVGWTVVLVPVVQICIVLAVALAESAIDLQLLLDGQDVPLIKDGQTFICSPSGLANAAADKVIDVAVDKATDYVSDKVDATIDNIDNAANKTIADCEAEINDALQEYLNQQVHSIQTAISSNLTTPLIAQITPIISRMNSANDNAKDVTREQVNAAFDTIELNLNGMDEGLVKKYALKIFRERAKPEKDNIIDAIVEKIEQTGTSTSPNEIKKIIDDKINIWLEGITMSLQEELNKTIITPMKDSIMEHKGEAVSNLKSYMHDEIGKAGQQLSGTVKSNIKDAASQVAENTINTKSSSVAAKITMNYKEYCKVFMLIGLVGNENENNMLKRAAVLMQLNVNYAVKGGSNVQPAGSQDFHMNQAYTMFYVGAEMKMGTLFPWGVSIEDDGENTNMSFDFSNLGDHYVTLKYGGIAGY